MVAQECPALARTQPILEETFCGGFWALSCCTEELPHPNFFSPSCQGTTDLLITDTDVETKQSFLCSVLCGS